MSAIDIIVFVAYFLILAGIGFWVGRRHTAPTTEDYFLGSRNLPWYTVGASFIGSNISTEHFIGMIGAAYIYGICVANWEWSNVMAFSVLIWFFIPFLLHSKVFTVPEFLGTRFDRTTSLQFSFITIITNVFVFLAVALYSGALGLDATFGISQWVQTQFETSEQASKLISLYGGCLIIGISAGSYAIFGGLTSVVWTDVFQVVIMIFGGLLVTLLGLQWLGNGDFMLGWKTMFNANQGLDALGQPQAEFQAAIKEYAEKAFPAGSPNELKDNYSRLSVIQPVEHSVIPWHSLIFSWVSISIWYNCINQTMIQRVLAAKNEWHAKMGIVFAGFMKIFLPFIIIVPGLIVFTMDPNMASPDASYPYLIQKVIPIGILGLLMAALFGAIQSSIDSVLHSTSTIVVMDIMKSETREHMKQVKLGRMVSVVILIFAILFSPLIIFLGDGVFGYVQNLYAHFAPSFSAVFIMGLLWKGTSARSAAITVPFGIILSFAIEFGLKNVVPFLEPFLIRSIFIWFVSIALLVGISLFDRKWDPKQLPEGVCINWSTIFKPSSSTPLLKKVGFWWSIYIAMTIFVYIAFSSLLFA